MHGEIIEQLLKFVDLDTLARTAKANKLWLDKSEDSWHDRNAADWEDFYAVCDEEAEIRSRCQGFEFDD